MELDAKEMQLAIEALIAYKDDDNEEYNEDLDLLITKFSTYLKGGESWVTQATLKFLRDFSKKSKKNGLYQLTAMITSSCLMLPKKSWKDLRT